MEAIFLVCGAGGPQLKRNPLGRANEQRAGAERMPFQLALQFAGDACPAFDDLVALEEELRAHMPASATVDGHDMGSGEANIFIATSDPTAVFSAILPILRKRDRLKGLRAAYRPQASQEYVNLWPEGSSAPFSVK